MTIYHYEQFEINVMQRDNCVIMLCLDKQLLISYQEIFTSEIIINRYNICNLNNFIVIIKRAFSNRTFVILLEHDKLNFEINIFYN
jgi:hypothetical protein